MHDLKSQYTIYVNSLTVRYTQNLMKTFLKSHSNKKNNNYS